MAIIQHEKELHIKRCGPFQNADDEAAFEHNLRYYPLSPYAPPSGSYGSRVDAWPDASFDRELYETEDPMYYTPKRAYQLGYAYFTNFDREEYLIALMHSPKVKLSTKRQTYRRMLLEKSNTTGAQLEVHEVHGAVLESEAFELNHDEDSLEFKAQMLEFMLWTINPQRMLVLETILCLKTLGIYHCLDASTIQDVFEYSMIHPNAVVCTVCRSCRWIFANPAHNNDEFIMCVAPHCPARLQRRDRPLDAYMALPYDNFNYKMWVKYCRKYFSPEQQELHRMIRYELY